ncbi:hypothetical protein P2H44_03625 [Albimonas sp. CAU 1670]|uniref:hypothetical protein n=1 Tax=Albimonas sp. CAU 1670 TaxID=3032599 RepID=UPI0023DC4DF4|nr:hypothetical protein [Albimonas sp. CAU 1670]MDF2231635.1 hypothetical protein [Albimonas sp. CAU 1670]
MMFRGPTPARAPSSPGPLRRLSRALRGGLAGACAAGLLTAAPAGAAETARFRVDDTVVNADLPAFSVVLHGRGVPNGSRFISDSFEPAIRRYQFEATADAPDRVIARAADISRWDTMREGAFNGAEVEVLRIVDGAFQRIRLDRVAAGGHLASGWQPYFMGPREALPAGARSVDLAWEPWYRPDAETWFTVRAVGKSGAMSPPASAVSAISPRGGKRQGWERPDDEVIKLEAPAGDAKGAAPGAPTGLKIVRSGPRQVLSWSPPADGSQVAGYVVFRSETPPERMNGYALVLEDGADAASIRAGDLVILRATFPDVRRETFSTHRTWNAQNSERLRPNGLRDWPGDRPGVDWRLRPHVAGSPVEAGGRSYLELDVNGVQPGEFYAGGAGEIGNDWFQVLRPGETYRVEFWARSETPGRAVVRFGGGGPYTRAIRPQIVETTPDWRRLSVEFTPPVPTGDKNNRLLIEFNGPNVFSIDNLRVYRADAPYLALLPEDEARLRDAHLSAIRLQATSTTREMTYDLELVTNPAGAGGGTQGANTLPQMLALVDGLGVDPWLTFEPHLSQDEWLGLVEYLAAPADAGPWARKRADQGRAAPWTDAFDRIYIELGNETWNRIYRPWVYETMTDAATGEVYERGEVYGLFFQHVIDEMRASPWWQAAGLDDKVRFVIGGWDINSYGPDAARRAPSADLMTVGAYIMGLDGRQDLPSRTPETFLSVLNWVTQASLRHTRRQIDLIHEVERETGRKIELGTYEAGPGYVMRVNKKRLSPEAWRIQESVMKSQAAGTATLDNFLMRAAAGYRMQTYFHYDTGGLWASHANWPEGGHDYPGWRLLRLFNTEATGDMLQVDTLSVPSADLPKLRHFDAVPDAPLAGVYATRRGDRLSVFVLSRRIPGVPEAGDSGCMPVEIDLPIRSAKSLTLHRMAAPYDAENSLEEQVKLETLSLTPPADASKLVVDETTGGQACGLPPAASYLYVFDGAG